MKAFHSPSLPVLKQMHGQQYSLRWIALLFVQEMYTHIAAYYKVHCTLSLEEVSL